VRAYAEYILMEEWQPILVPEGVPDEAAAMTEPSAVAVHAVRKSNFSIGDSVGIIGAGPIGMLCVQVARAAGASAVFVSEPVRARREAAAALGCDAVIDPITEDAEERMTELTGGIGPDVVFDCAGIGPTLDQAFNTVRGGGQVILVAVPWEPMPVLAVDWMARETEFKASWGSNPEDWRIVLGLMQSGKLSVAPLLSDASFIPLDGIQEAFDALTKPSTELQVIVRP
jgi:(R,R)-butanediol dehydrogenase/meso-butanediol dehydrogenase/diacetyl reductase